MASSNGNMMEQLETQLRIYLYDKAPHLPAEWQEILVKFLPYLAILFVVLSLPVLLAALGLGAIFSPFILMGGLGTFSSYSLTLIIFAISIILEAVAIPGLFARSSKAWTLLYYSALVNALYNFLSFNFFGFVIGGIVSLYLLFQIKKYYSHR